MIQRVCGCISRVPLSGFIFFGESIVFTSIDRIAAAQAADPDGYINTYTTLMRAWHDCPCCRP